MVSNTFIWHLFPNLKKTSISVSFLRKHMVTFNKIHSLTYHNKCHPTWYNYKQKQRNFFLPLHKENNNVLTNSAYWAFSVLIVCGPHSPQKIPGVKMCPPLWFLFTTSTIETNFSKFCTNRYKSLI
jgi:hypothetical protein